MLFRSCLFAAAAVALLAANGSARGQTLDDGLKAKIESVIATRLRTMAASADIVAAVKAQNLRTGGMDHAAILAADKAWRAEVGTATTPTIDTVTNNPVSNLLRERRTESNGLIDEVFVMDAKGLNVAMSDTTSDYWQGDEEKFTETFPMGPNAVHISPIDFDQSTQSYTVQVSLPILEGRTPIGAITFGLNVDALNSGS